MMERDMTRQQIKKEMRDAALAGIRDWLKSTRGANALGAQAEVTEVGGVLSIRGYAHEPGQTGPAYFEVRISEKF